LDPHEPERGLQGKFRRLLRVTDDLGVALPGEGRRRVRDALPGPGEVIPGETFHVHHHAFTPEIAPGFSSQYQFPAGVSTLLDPVSASLRLSPSSTPPIVSRLSKMTRASFVRSSRKRLFERSSSGARTTASRRWYSPLSGHSAL